MRHAFRSLAGQIVAVGWALASGAVRADVTLPAIISDHMVLQADMPACIWGKAEAGEAVEVAFAGQTKKTVATPQGTWRVTLEPLAASAEGRTLVVNGRNRIEVGDVIVGEVWLGSGQSNMEMTVNAMQTAAEDKAQADLPLVRHFTVRAAPSTRTLDDCIGSWKVCSPETVGGFSAVLYPFGRALFLARKVPVGLINSSVGGSHIYAWFPPEVTAADPTLAPARYSIAALGADANFTTKDGYVAFRNAVLERMGEPKDPAKVPPWYSALVCGLYNGMIAPIENFVCRGIIWYQGEADAGDPRYAEKLGALAKSWREKRAAPEMPFYWVQLPNLSTKRHPRGEQPTHHAWATMRDIQRRAVATIPNGGMVVTIDGPDPGGHPKVKRYIGERLALLARRECYGEADVEASGPRLDRVSTIPGGLELSFTSQSSLGLREGEPNGFAVSADGETFAWARAVVDGRRIRLTSAAVPEPRFVRYAWDADPYVSLFNEAGLPASPFAASVDGVQAGETPERR